MRISSGLRIFALLAAGLAIVASRVEAQGIGYLIQGPSSIGVSNTINFTITLTNQMATTQITTTNTISGTLFQLGAATTSLGGAPLVGTTNVIFNLGSMTSNQIATMTLAVTPTSTGSLSNTLSVATNGVLIGIAPPFVVLVTNTLSVADLAVAMTGPSALVFSNDWMTYGVNVTNLGPGTAPNTFLTNTLPPGVGLKRVSPSSQAYSLVRSNVIFNLGTLTNGAFGNFQLTVQPTNAGTWTFSSMVGTNNVVDPNPNNNSASINVVVSDFFPGNLVAVTNSPQTTNFQNGFIEQSILLSNVGTNAATAARVVVTGLKTNLLFNAVGTNNGSPFVVYNSTLNTTQSVSLLLQYYVSTRSAFHFTNSQLQAYSVSPLDLTPPPAVVTSDTNFIITRIVRRADGSMLIEWPSITNRSYTVVYSDDASFANAMMAPPSIVAPANRTQWIDYGPPATVSHPTNAPVRLYRVLLNH